MSEIALVDRSALTSDADLPALVTKEQVDALVARMITGKEAEACRRCLQRFQPLPIQVEGDAHARLFFAIAEYRGWRQAAVSYKAMAAALQGIIAAQRETQKHINTLYSAKVSAPPSDAERQHISTLAYAIALETLLPGAPLENWDERQFGQAGPRLAFAHFVTLLEALQRSLELDARKTPTRTHDAALERIIGTLAKLWRELDGTEPTAHVKSTQAGWRSPFAKFVETLWRAIDNHPPSNKTIAEALRRVPPITSADAAKVRDCLAPDAVPPPAPETTKAAD